VLGRPVWRRVEGDFAELLTRLTVIFANSSLSRAREKDQHRFPQRPNRYIKSHKEHSSFHRSAED
jgi:hypothetical protein